MPTNLPRVILEIKYEEAAQQYLHSLPPEHFMESTAQATQREITVESLALVHATRPEVQYFSELLVQYPLPGSETLGQVVPDGMVVIWEQPLKLDLSFDLPLQPTGPFWVLDYPSDYTRRKDYDGHVRQYEHELKVPYYLRFHVDTKELSLYRHTGEKYALVEPNEIGRYPIRELDLEVGVLGDWMRYWHQGKLLQSPAEMWRELANLRREMERLRGQSK
jgi:Uma2 family endonuclease